MNDDYIVRSNIKRFEQLLAIEQDVGRRAMLTALLDEERSKAASPSPQRGKPAQPPA